MENKDIISNLHVSIGFAMITHGDEFYENKFGVDIEYEDDEEEIMIEDEVIETIIFDLETDEIFVYTDSYIEKLDVLSIESMFNLLNLIICR